MLKITKPVPHREKKSMVYKYTFYSLRMSSVMPYNLVTGHHRIKSISENSRPAPKEGL